MGQSCCVWRKEPQEVIKFEPKKNLLAIALVSVLQEQCTGLRNKLSLLEEISKQYAFNHHCCYIDPTFLQSRFSLIEFQSPGTLVPQNYSLSAAFHTEIAYLVEEGLIERGQNYSIILLLKVDGSLHPFSVKRRTRSSKPLQQQQQQQSLASTPQQQQQPQQQPLQQQSYLQQSQTHQHAVSQQQVYYIIHDIFSVHSNHHASHKQNPLAQAEITQQQVKGLNCKDIEFETVESLNFYLDMVQFIHLTSKQPSSSTIQLQLLSFDVSDEKSFSCAESESAYRLALAAHDSSDDISQSDKKSGIAAPPSAALLVGQEQHMPNQVSTHPTPDLEKLMEHKLPSRHHSAGHFRSMQSQQPQRFQHLRRRKSTTPLKSMHSTRINQSQSQNANFNQINSTNNRIAQHDEHLHSQQDNASTIKEMTEEHQTSAIDSFSTEIENALRTTLDSAS